MKTSLYVSFPGNAREALEFYHEVFGGELDIITYGEQLDRGAQFPFCLLYTSPSPRDRG